MTFYIHCDLNKFYSSIIHSFQPWLSLTPTITLSNNDGCNICFKPGWVKSDLGIGMGTPIFEVDDLVKRFGIEVVSCNFPLIADISLRVKSVLGRFFEDIEDYSIDEIFCRVDAPLEMVQEMCREARRVISKGLGLPISIGISTTKTLAKVATRFAKKYPGYNGVCTIHTDTQRKKALSLTDIEDIWGIGRQHRKRLNKLGIKTAFDWVDRIQPAVIKKHMTVVAERTFRELCGESCLELEMITPRKKSITVSRSFGNNIADFDEISEALSTYATMAAAKLRKQGSKAKAIYVFLETNPFREDHLQTKDEIIIKLPVATSSTIEICGFARLALRCLFRKGYIYKKVGLIAMNICDENAIQANLYDTRDRKKEDRLMKASDTINERFGANKIKPLATGLGKRPWHIRQEKLPPNWSTRIADIPKIKDWPVSVAPSDATKDNFIVMAPVNGITPTVLRATS